MNGTICQTTSPVPAVALSRGRHGAFAAILFRAFERLMVWRERARSRRMLLAMDDRLLSDIGIDRATAQVEGERPFWK